MEIYITAQDKLVTLDEFLAMHAETSFPPTLTAELLASFGAETVLESPRPTAGQFQTVTRNGTTVVNGKRFTAWRLENWSPAQIAQYQVDAKARKWSDIKAERERRLVGGVLVDGYWFHTDDTSKIKMLALVMMGPNIPPDLQWKTMNRDAYGEPVFVSINQALANKVFMAIAQHEQAVFAVAEDHRVAMEGLENPALYDASTNWPEFYRG